VGFAWTLVGDDTSGAIVGADQANATVVAPASGVTVVRLTVTDDHGSTDSADVTVGPDFSTATFKAPLPGDACAAPVAIAAEPPPAPDLPPPPEPAPDPNPRPSGGGGGGGGALDSWLLLGLVATCRLLRRSRVGSC